IKCWGYNGYGQLGLGDASSRGDDPNELGTNLPSVDLGAGKTPGAVITGYQHACAILDDATVKCWGGNDEGQLGLGDLSNRGDDSNEMGTNLPSVDLGAGRKVKALSAGMRHTCALLDDATIKCWGYNGYGQLGLGDASNRGDDPYAEMGTNLTSVDLGPGRTAVAVVAGSWHTCALLEDASIKCWGLNEMGQLGLRGVVVYGDVEDRGDNPYEMGTNLSSIDLGLGRTAKAITAGGGHTCALMDDASVKCWGMNIGGQLGIGDTLDRGYQLYGMGKNLSSVDLGVGRTALVVEAGGYHTCALLDDATVKCWGYNEEGQLGTGDASHRGDNLYEMGENLTSIDLGAGRTPVAIVASWFYTCALLVPSTFTESPIHFCHFSFLVQQRRNSASLYGCRDQTDLGFGPALRAGGKHAHREIGRRGPAACFSRTPHPEIHALPILSRRNTWTASSLENHSDKISSRKIRGSVHIYAVLSLSLMPKRAYSPLS
ncbi:regulator of chromosome condensation 1/beta-lactamase-inhibitor protein II, partial [Baffinella frigidus]